MPVPVISAITNHIELEGRIGGYEAQDARRQAIEAAYQSVANLIGANARNIAFTENATASFMQALSAIPFKRNDIILTTRNDYVWYARSFFFGGMILSSVFFLLSLTYVVSGHLMAQGWYVSQGLRSMKRYVARGWVDRFFSAILFFVDRKVRFIVIKDVKSFLRDPVQWSQFLIFFGLLAIYFLNLRSFAYEERSMMWKNLIAQMNLLATCLTLATFSSRFIYPQLSLEGRRFWVIGMAPMTREKILFGKLALSFSCSLLISEGLISLSSWMLRTPFTLTVLHSVSLFGICLGLSGLSVGLGALYPNFSEDNPSKIVSGFGGTLNLVLSLFFVLIVLSLQAIPCFFYYGIAKLTGDEFRWLIVGSMVAIAIVSLVTCLIPLRMGLKAIERLEI